MSESVSIQFKKGNELSVALFSQDDGSELIEEAEKYAIRLKAACGGRDCWPLERFQPNTVMVDFIRYLLKERRITVVESNYYLGKDETCGFNSDHGNHIIDFDSIALPQSCTTIPPILDLNEAGKILKVELEKTFAKKKFSVRTKKFYTGEELIFLDCKHRPLLEAVKKIAEKYEIFLKDENGSYSGGCYRRVLLNRKPLHLIKPG